MTVLVAFSVAGDVAERFGDGSQGRSLAFHQAVATLVKTDAKTNTSAVVAFPKAASV